MRRIAFFMIILCFCAFSFGEVSNSSTKKEKWIKLLESHPDFESFEFSLFRENLFINYEYDIDVKLKNRKTISFACVDKHGGGKYCCVSKIGEFSVDSRILVKNRQIPAAGINFIDLSHVIKKEINSINDAINNYDDILEFVSNLAKEQYFLGVIESSWLDSYSWINNQEIIKKFPKHFSFKGNRQVVMFVETIKGYPQWVWDGIQDDEIKHCKVFYSHFGEGWEHKHPENEIKKILGL